MLIGNINLIHETHASHACGAQARMSQLQCTETMAEQAWNTLLHTAQRSPFQLNHVHEVQPKDHAGVGQVAAFPSPGAATSTASVLLLHPTGVTQTPDSDTVAWIFTPLLAGQTYCSNTTYDCQTIPADAQNQFSIKLALNPPGYLNTDYCMDVYSFATTPGAPVILGPCHFMANQRYTVYGVSDEGNQEAVQVAGYDRAG